MKREMLSELLCPGVLLWKNVCTGPRDGQASYLGYFWGLSPEVGGLWWLLSASSQTSHCIHTVVLKLCIPHPCTPESTPPPHTPVPQTP